MSIKCECGAKCSTKFCPSCGKQINADVPICKLITYLKSGIHRLSKSIQIATSDARKERLQARLEEWKTWLQGAQDAFDIQFGREKEE